jgi:hypothetical protein
VILVLVLVTLALVATLAAGLARTSGTEALLAARRANSLRHRLAAESALAMLPVLLAEDRQLLDRLDRSNLALFAFETGDLLVDVELQDDSAKLPLRLMNHLGSTHLVTSLQHLASSVSLPQATPRFEVRAIGCLEDILTATGDDELFPRDGTTAWASFVSVVGQTININRAHPAVLEAGLLDLDPDLGKRICRERKSGVEASVSESLAKLELDGRVAAEATRRLSDRTQHYSLLVRSRLQHDVRRRYLICSAGDPPAVVVDWEIAP